MPQLRLHRPQVALGLGALLAALALSGPALALSGPALAQGVPAAPDNGIFDPPGGQGVLTPEAANEAPLVRGGRTFGNPAAFGAGKSGFDSTNARRKIQAASDRKKRAQPLAQPVTTPATPARPLPPSPAAARAQVSDPSVTGSVAPAYYQPPPPRVKPKLQTPETGPYAPLGIRAGAFILKPAVEFSVGHDSNVPRSPAPQSSSFYTVAPELQVKSDWERHEFRANLRGNYNGYPDLPLFNRPFLESVLDGRVDVTSQTRVELQNRFQYATETPGSPNFQTDAAKPTVYTNVGGTAGLFHRFNRLEVGGKAIIDRTRYDDSELNNGMTVSNNDRDFVAYGLELRGSYEWSPGVKPFVALTSDKRVYDLSQDRFGIHRDSDGLTPRIGTTFEFSRQLTGDVSVGYMTRKYDDPQLKDVSGIVADASLIWDASALTKAAFTAKSSVYESTDPDVSGVLARDFGVQVDHAFREWLIATVKFGYGLDDYVGTARVDNRFIASAGLTYKMNRNVQWKGEARREQRTSNVQGEDYTANIFLLGLRLQE